MNVVTLIGDVVTDVEVKQVGNRRVAGFLLAVDRSAQRGGADFIHVSAWGRQADACARFLAKGRRVGIGGRLRSRSWEEADGSRRSAVEVVASSVEFLFEAAPAQAPREAAGTR